MTITYFDPLTIAGHEPTSSSGADHPMRAVTRQVAGLQAGEWNRQKRFEVASLFDDLAAEWHTRALGPRQQVVDDAFDRGVAALWGVRATPGLCIEGGSGIGTYSPYLAERFDQVIAVELSMEMARRSPTGPAHRVLGDLRELPVADGHAAAVVLINAFLFPEEVDRVLADDGIVVWVNSSGTNTPIHLLPAEVADVLPGCWRGVAAEAGAGLWCVLTRDGVPA